jgi:hypothetical protein
MSGLRIAGLVVVLNPIVSILVGLLYVYDISWPIWCAALCGLLALAYGTAVVGVSRARGGEMPCWTGPSWFRRRQVASPRLRSPFVAAEQAQRWLEWRCRGLAFPIVVGCLLLFWSPGISWIASGVDESMRVNDDSTQAMVLRQIGGLWWVVVCLLFVPPLLATLCAIDMGKLGTRKRVAALSAFVASRPLSCWQIVRIKFRLALRCTLVGWGVFAVGLLMWFTFGGRAEEMMHSFDALRRDSAAVPFWTTIGLLVGGAVLLTWLEMVKGMWPGLTGRAWLVSGSLLNCGQTFGLAILGFNLAIRPNDWEKLAAWLPWLAAGVVVVKGVAASWAMWALWCRRLVPSLLLGGLLAAWFLLALALFALLSWLIPRAWFSVSGTVLGLALLLPLTRLLLMPLAVAWNRHR